jgi:hypothetical protein
MFNLQVSTTNAAFEDDYTEEIVRILASVHVRDHRRTDRVGATSPDPPRPTTNHLRRQT